MAPPCGSAAAVSQDVEALVGLGWGEMLRELGKLGVAQAERVRAAGIAGLKARQAGLVGQVKQMQLMRRARLIDQPAHPFAAFDCVGREVEHDREAGLQQVKDMGVSARRSFCVKWT